MFNWKCIQYEGNYKVVSLRDILQFFLESGYSVFVLTCTGSPDNYEKGNVNKKIRKSLNEAYCKLRSPRLTTKLRSAGLERKSSRNKAQQKPR